ncbi:MAG: polysaccharide biosynthesis C-terminal domain-containing protein [Candidatus Eremiobacteraeota bacterium]|nr:polysaccharide biosynthesis C-terminal domain-containing protein [Candidatus Eremiobacteraeota bacterium]
MRINTSLALLNTFVLFAFMLTLLTVMGHRPAGAIVAWVAGTNILGAAIIVWMLVDARGRFADSEPVPISFRNYISYAMRVGSVSLVSLLNYRADVYVVAVFTPPAMLGMYTLAVTAAETLLAATQVTAVVTMPHVGSMDRDAAAQLTARCVRHNVIVAAVCCGLLALVAPSVVHLLYGAAFLPMVPALRILLVGVFALSLGSPMSNFFTIRLGKPEVPLVLASASAAICIATSIVLVPRIGLVGAAFGSTLAYVLGQGAAIVYFSMISGISAGRVLVPRVSDIETYGAILSGFARRLRRT